VKDLWLKAIKAGNCDTFAGLTYSNVARYCPNADKIILVHLVLMQQNVRSNKPIMLTPPPVRPQPSRPQRHRSTHHGRSFFVSTSANCIQITQEGSVYYELAQAINMSLLLTTRTGSSSYNKLFRQKQINTAFLLLLPSWHGWQLVGFLLISISEIMRPVQTSSESSKSHGKLSSNLFLQTCTGETKPSG
jgi:hypothetical protein